LMERKKKKRKIKEWKENFGVEVKICGCKQTCPYQRQTQEARKNFLLTWGVRGNSLQENKKKTDQKEKTKSPRKTDCPHQKPKWGRMKKIGEKASKRRGKSSIRVRGNEKRNVLKEPRDPRPPPSRSKGWFRKEKKGVLPKT